MYLFVLVSVCGCVYVTGCVVSSVVYMRSKCTHLCVCMCFVVVVVRYMKGKAHTCLLS